MSEEIRMALISPCEQYRYNLYRIWDQSKPQAMFIGLNPSTADAMEDDATIRRMRGFAKSWGCGGIVVANLFAYRTKDPDYMKGALDPVGPGNDAQITLLLKIAEFRGAPVVAVWGHHGEFMGRAKQVERLILENSINIKLQCFGTTQKGFPRHPLYLKGDTPLEEYDGHG